MTTSTESCRKVFVVVEVDEATGKVYLKYYLSSPVGRAFCFGYGVTGLSLQKDGTWEKDISF